jgi:hypothetical protein
VKELAWAEVNVILSTLAGATGPRPKIARRRIGAKICQVERCFNRAQVRDGKEGDGIDRALARFNTRLYRTEGRCFSLPGQPSAARAILLLALALLGIAGCVGLSAEDQRWRDSDHQ